MKKFLAIILSFLCLFFVGCGATQGASDSQSKSSTNSEQQSDTDTESSSTDTTSEEPAKPTTREATLDDFVLISFDQVENNCILKFSVSDEIKNCVLRLYLIDKDSGFSLVLWTQDYYFVILRKNQIEEFKFAFYEDQDTKDIHFEEIQITILQGTIELD